MRTKNLQLLSGPYGEISTDYYQFGLDGKSVLLISGIHAGELGSQAVLYNYISKLQEKESELRGIVAILPCADQLNNNSQIQQPDLGRYSLFDMLNLNREFPGKEEGTPTQRIAKKIFDFAKDFDLVIDLHCDTNSLPYTLCFPDNFSSFGRFSGCDLVESYDFPEKELVRAVKNIGKEAFILEVGASDVITRDMIQKNTQSLDSLLSFYSILQQEIIESKQWYKGGEQIYYLAEQGGLLVRDKRIGDIIKKEEIFATIVSKKGNFPIRASETSLLKKFPSYSLVNEGMKTALLIPLDSLRRYER